MKKSRVCDIALAEQFSKALEQKQWTRTDFVRKYLKMGENTNFRKFVNRVTPTTKFQIFNEAINKFLGEKNEH